MKSFFTKVLSFGVLPAVVGLAVWFVRREATGEAESRAFGVGLAEGLNVGGFHRDPLSGEASIAQAALAFRYPEPNDAQRLAPACSGVCTAYVTGPVAIRVYATAEGSLSDFDRKWVSVAGLTVAPKNRFPEWGLDGGQKPGSVVAHELQLWADKQNASDPQWKAQIVANGVVVKPPLEVHFEQDPTAPTTAGFFWDGKSSKRQMIGVKCPGGMCFVGQEKLKPRWEGKDKRCTDAAETHCATWGYFDEQELATDPGSGNLEKSGSRGLIVPLAGAALPDNATFFNTFQDVAAVRISGKDYGKRLVTIRKDLEAVLAVTWKSADNKWYGRLTQNGNIIADDLPISRHDHGTAPVLAAARWKWSLTDEGIWVRCGPGCCEVDLN